jgi:Iap family predicted aminopeptidase
MTADLLESKFRKLGLQDIHREEFALSPQWFPTDWNMAASSGAKTLTFQSAFPTWNSKPTPAGDIQAEAVWVGFGTAADFSGRDVRGKVAVVHSMLAPGNMGNSATWEGAARRAAERGAVAVVLIWGYAENFMVVQNSGTNQIPGFYIGYEDGKALRDLIAEGTVNLTLKLQVDMRPNLKSVSIYGTLPGATDENIIVMGHMDGWFQGALDNASGLSVMLELAEHFSHASKEKRRRSITFIGTAGHHVGSPNAAFLHKNRETLLAKTALMINCEHVSYSDHETWSTKMRQSNEVAPLRYWIYGSPSLAEITLGSYRTFRVPLIGDMDDRATGEMGQVSRDAPSIQVIRSPEFKHTDRDTPDIVPAAGMESIARAYAKIIDQVNKLGRRNLMPAAPQQSAVRVQ